jgi:EpsI family protein
MILIPTLLHARLVTQSAVPLLKSFQAFPAVLGEWKGHKLEESDWHPEVIGASDNLSRFYKDDDGNTVKVFVSYLPLQIRGQELVYHANTILPQGYKFTTGKLKTWTINANPLTIRLETNLLESRNEMRDETLLCWYQNTNHYSHSKYLAKALMALDSLLKNRSNGSVFVLIYRSAAYGSDDREIKIQDFLNEFMPEITKYVPS